MGQTEDEAIFEAIAHGLYRSVRAALPNFRIRLRSSATFGGYHRVMVFAPHPARGELLVLIQVMPHGIRLKYQFDRLEGTLQQTREYEYEDPLLVDRIAQRVKMEVDPPPLQHGRANRKQLTAWLRDCTPERTHVER